MNLSDSKLIAADRNEVWQALLSAEVLQQCVPGCKEMSGSPEEGFEATVVQKAVSYTHLTLPTIYSV